MDSACAAPVKCADACALDRVLPQPAACLAHGAEPARRERHAYRSSARTFCASALPTKLVGALTASVRAFRACAVLPSL